MRHGEDNRGKCTDNPAGCHPIWTIGASTFIRIYPGLRQASNMLVAYLEAWFAYLENK